MREEQTWCYGDAEKGVTCLGGLPWDKEDIRTSPGRGDKHSETEEQKSRQKHRGSKVQSDFIYTMVPKLLEGKKSLIYFSMNIS